MSFFTRERKNGDIELRGGRVLAVFVIVCIVALLLATSLRKVPAGHKGIYVNGAGIGTQKDEGWALKNPFSTMENVEYVTQSIEETIQILTRDGFNVPVDWQITYRLSEDRVGEIRTDNPDWKNTVLINALRSGVRTTASNMNLTGYDINVRRTTFEAAVELAVIEKCTPYYIEIESVNIRNIDLPQTILNAAEIRAAAEIDIDTAEYELAAVKMRAQKVTMEAEAEANATIVLALGQAESIRILSQEAENMTDDMMQYILTLRYIAALRDPESNVQFIVVPMDGQPIMLDMTGLQEAAVNGTI